MVPPVSTVLLVPIVRDLLSDQVYNFFRESKNGLPLDISTSDMPKEISILARRRHEFSARRNLTGTVVLESIVLAGSKMREKRAGEKIFEKVSACWDTSE